MLGLAGANPPAMKGCCSISARCYLLSPFRASSLFKKGHPESPFISKPLQTRSQSHAKPGNPPASSPRFRAISSPGEQEQQGIKRFGMRYGASHPPEIPLLKADLTPLLMPLHFCISLLDFSRRGGRQPQRRFFQQALNPPAGVSTAGLLDLKEATCLGHCLLTAQPPPQGAFSLSAPKDRTSGSLSRAALSSKQGQGCAPCQDNPAQQCLVLASS